MSRLRPILLLGAALVSLAAPASAGGPPARPDLSAERESARAFMALQEGFKRELEAALVATNWDKAAAAPALDAAVARVQPAFDSHALEMLERERAKIARLPARQRQQRLAAATNFYEMIRGTPQQLRLTIERNGSLTPPPPPPPMHR
jgi:hypothetical protein